MSEWIASSAYLPFVALSVIGIHMMLSHRSFLKALIGLNVFQVAIILFFIVLAADPGATIPIQEERTEDERGASDAHHASALHYDPHTTMHNPLPHALMLTAIVVGVATQGVGLAILRRIHAETGTIEDTGTDLEGEASS